MTWMKRIGFEVFWLVGCLGVLVGCNSADSITPSPTQEQAAPTAVATTVPPTVAPTSLPTVEPTATPTEMVAMPEIVEADLVESLLSQMSLAEKIGQMTLVEKDSISPADVTTYHIGAILSGGGGYPQGNNTPAGWHEMVTGFQQAALKTPLGIPLLYGVDAVHGHNNVWGATIFPHNVGLGAAGNAELVEEIGRITAIETLATGIHWNYSPVLAVPQDIRWGRTYEGYSENTDLVTTLGTAMLQGLQGNSLAENETMLATPKHWIADGGAAWGTSTTGEFIIDRGDAQIDEATLRRVHMPPYITAIESGAQSVMISYSSWQGTRMHAESYLINDVLKAELGFAGFVVSDWQAIDEIEGDYYSDVVTGINAGIDMNMVPYDYQSFINTLTQAVEQGDVSIERIDDAVRRILQVKQSLGLFEQPTVDDSSLAVVGAAEHRAVAQQAVRESLVLLKNYDRVLPIDEATELIYVGGLHADDMGLQSGGWTVEWQGMSGDLPGGTSILDGIKAAVSAETTVKFNRFGKFENEEAIADVGIVVIGENAYAEGIGDKADLTLNGTMVTRMGEFAENVIVVIVTGRPLIITEWIDDADAIVVAWLPGSEGSGVSDLLFGDFDFVGQLPYSWPRAAAQLPFDFDNMADSGCGTPLFPFGYGLTFSSDSVVEVLDCPEFANQESD